MGVKPDLPVDLRMRCEVLSSIPTGWLYFWAKTVRPLVLLWPVCLSIDYLGDSLLRECIITSR